MELEQLENKVEKKHGGARPNSGPKKGSQRKGTRLKMAAQIYLTHRIEAKLGELTTALIDKALTGDIPAIKEALERGLGKVIEKKQIEMRQQLPFDAEQADNGIQEGKDPQ